MSEIFSAQSERVRKKLEFDTEAITDDVIADVSSAGYDTVRIDTTSFWVTLPYKLIPTLRKVVKTSLVDAGSGDEPRDVEVPDRVSQNYDISIQVDSRELAL